MENSLLKISKALLDLARVSDTVLYSTPKAHAALCGTKLESGQRSLLERIDGFRSIEQLLAMSGDLIGAHGTLGKLMAAGYVTSATGEEEVAEEVVPVAEKPVEIPARAKAPAAPPPAARAPAPTPEPTPEPAPEPTELEHAKRLLLMEAKLALGGGAGKLRPRIEACASIEEIYDLIVKIQEHLATTGKADPGEFLDRLSDDLAAARKKSVGVKKRASVS